MHFLIGLLIVAIVWRLSPTVAIVGLILFALAAITGLT